MTRALVPLSWLYGWGMGLRNAAFDHGLFPVAEVSVPVISVGNMTAGGTGKTPLVEYIARRLQAGGSKVAIVSRGYQRISSGVVTVSDGRTVLVDADVGGDEPVQMARKLKGVCVVVGEQRADAARIAVGDCGAEVVVLDDGFQHRWIRRDLDILVLDPRIDLIRQPILPAGTRREPLAGMARAGLAVFSKMADDGRLPDWSARLQQWYNGPVVKCQYAVENVKCAPDDGAFPRDRLKEMRIIAFSGIGDHGSFLESLVRIGIKPVGERRFPDHHRYGKIDIDSLETERQRVEADCFLTTEKDMTRLTAGGGELLKFFGRTPVLYTTVGIRFIEGAGILDGAVDACSRRGRG